MSAVNFPKMNLSLAHAGPLTDLTRFNYTTLQPLAAGQFGRAYLVKCHLTNELYVAKFVDLGILADKDRMNCVQEAHILKLLDHANILKCRETLNPDSSTLILILEYCEGGDLHNCIANRKENNHQFSEKEIACIMRQLLDGLSYLHEKNIIHRDIKPANILLMRKDDFSSIKIADFGISKVMDQTLALAHTSIGTPAYMSPEMLRGGGNSSGYSYSSDIWALGCVLWEMCMMRSVYDSAESIGNLVHLITHRTKRVPKITSIHISVELKSMIHTMLNKVASHRQTPLYYLRKPYFQRNWTDVNPILDQNEIVESSEQPHITMGMLRSTLISFLKELDTLDMAKGCSIPKWVRDFIPLCRYGAALLQQGGVTEVFMTTAIDPKFDVAFEMETIFEDSDDEANNKMRQTREIKRAIMSGEPNIADSEDLCQEEEWDHDWIKRGIEFYHMGLSDTETSQIVSLLKDLDQDGFSDDFIVKDLVLLFGTADDLNNDIKESLTAIYKWRNERLGSASKKSMDNVRSLIGPVSADGIVSRSTFKSSLLNKVNLTQRLSALEVDLIYLTCPKDASGDVLIDRFFDDRPSLASMDEDIAMVNETTRVSESRRSTRVCDSIKITSYENSSSTSYNNSTRGSGTLDSRPDDSYNHTLIAPQLKSTDSHSYQLSFSSETTWTSFVGSCLKMMKSLWGLVLFLQEQRVSLAEVLIHKRHSKTFSVMFEIYVLKIGDIMSNLNNLSKRIRDSPGGQQLVTHNGVQSSLSTVVLQTTTVIQDIFDRNIGYLSTYQTSTNHYPQKKHLKVLRMFTSIVLNHMFSYIYAIIPRAEQLHRLNRRTAIIEELKSQVATCCSLAGMLEDNQCALGHYIYIMAADYQQSWRERKLTMNKLLRDVDMRQTFVSYLDSLKDADSEPDIVRQTLNNLADSDFELIDLLKHGQELCNVCCTGSRNDKPICVHIKHGISDVAIAVILQMKSLESHVRQRVNRIMVNVAFEVLEIHAACQTYSNSKETLVPERTRSSTKSYETRGSKRRNKTIRANYIYRPRRGSTDSNAVPWSIESDFGSKCFDDSLSYDMSSDTSSGHDDVEYLIPTYQANDRKRQTTKRVGTRSRSAMVSPPRPSRRDKNTKDMNRAARKGGPYLGLQINNNHTLKESVASSPLTSRSSRRGRFSSDGLINEPYR